MLTKHVLLASLFLYCTFICIHLYPSLSLFQFADDGVDDALNAAAKMANAAKVGTALKITTITLTGIGVVLDVITIGLTAKNVHEGNITEEATKLRQIADDIEGKVKDDDNVNDQTTNNDVKNKNDEDVTCKDLCITEHAEDDRGAVKVNNTNDKVFFSKNKLVNLLSKVRK